VALAKKDERLVAITAAMPTGTGLDAFANEFPDRFYDVGIAEGHAVTFAAGLATQGLRPVVAIYSSFMQRAIDSMIHDVCLQNLPVVFALDRAGFVGDDGPTHHGVFDLSYLRMVPNLTVLAPRSASMLGKMLEFAVTAKGPVALRYPRGTAPDDVCESQYAFEAGIAEVVYGGSSKVAIFAVGHLVSEAVNAAKTLAQEGIEVTVVDPRSIKPLDTMLLSRLAARCSHFITVEENVLTGGFGSAVNEWITANGVDVRLRILAIPDRFVDHAAQREQREMCGIDAAAIEAAARAAVKEATGPIEADVASAGFPLRARGNDNL
jgi:1-deoxy-D-xylulose-5-phosphate synthase